MKRICSYDYLDHDSVSIDVFHLSDSESEFYENIDFLYKCKANPSCYECTKDWLDFNFGVTSLDEAIKITSTKEYEFLENHDYIDYSIECGICKRYTCTFVNSRIVVIECHTYIDC